MQPSAKLLALETTDLTGSVATWTEGRLVRELPLRGDQRSAQSLAPGIAEILAQSGWRPSDVRVVAVTVGPGSFTGLRVGVTTAKVFAYCCGAAIVGVDTLEVLAAGAPRDFARLAVAVDAQRGDVVAGTFLRDATGAWRPDGPAQLIAWRVWLDALPEGTALVSPLLRKRVADVPARLIVASESCWQPRAACVAQLAASGFAQGQCDDLWKLAPHYCRRSAAEEKADRAAASAKADRADASDKADRAAASAKADRAAASDHAS
jgi:tRNA threonylcarbamoyladenosine biosynthesis protein TsaB